MARGVDSDYISSLSLMDGFDMSISFDGFGENMKKFMELPIKYLDSAHDKAVGIVEDIHAMISAPFPDDELPNKGHGTLKDPSSDNVITGSSPTSVEMEQVNPNEEFSSSPTSLITAEDSSLSSVDTDARQTKSVSSKSPDSCASEGIISLERTDGIKEEVILCNSENLSGSCTPENLISLGRTASIEEEIILWNPGNSVKPPQPPDVHVLTEPGNIVQDYVSQEVNTDKVMDQVEHVMCSSLSLRGHAGESSACYGAILLGKIRANGEEQSELYSANSPENPTENGNIMDLAGGTISHYLNADVFNGADGLNMFTDDTTYTVDIDLHDGQERMKNNKAEASSVTQPKNTSFKKILMRSLSNKLRWSKKDMNVHQAVPIRPQKAVNVPYEVVSSTDNLEDDWELL